MRPTWQLTTLIFVLAMIAVAGYIVSITRRQPPAPQSVSTAQPTFHDCSLRSLRPDSHFRFLHPEKHDSIG